MSTRFNPFQPSQKENEKEETHRLPTDIADLLTKATHHAVITSDGELKLRGEAGDAGKRVDLMKERYWGALKYSDLFYKRLASETPLISKKFSRFKLEKSDSDIVFFNWKIAMPGQLMWVGPLRTYSGKDYNVALAYPFDYPFAEMRSFVIDPLIPRSEHRFMDGHLCLYDHKGKGGGFESNRTTAVTFIAWTAAWLHAYEIWDKTGSWPTLEDTQQ